MSQQGRGQAACQLVVRSDHGSASQYVRNIEVEPRVRVLIDGHWYGGTACPIPDDDARARLRSLPIVNGLVVRALGTDLLSIRVDLDGRRSEE